MTQARIINGRYRIERALQVGPLATTHLARDLDADDSTEALVVLKELSLQAHAGDTSEALARYKLLEREARILRNLKHPGIPTFIDTFRTEGDKRVSVWLVQEYREGRNLRDMVADGWHGSAEDIVGILRQVAEVLDYLHTRVPSIVHRDVKPANIIVGSDGRVSLVDLGAACTRVLENRTGSTIVGTPGYVPMEQFVGQAVPASDVYALGMVGIHLITHEEPLSLIREDGSVHYKHLAQLEHPTLLPTIERMVEPGVSARLRNARAVLNHLDGSEDAGRSEARGATDKRQRPARSPRGRAFAYAGAGIALMGMLTGAVVLMSNRSGDPDVPEQSEQFEGAEGDEDDGDDPEEMPSPSEFSEPTNPHEPLDKLAQVPAAQEPECQVEVQWKKRGQPWREDGDDAVDCTLTGSVLEPMIVGPGRVRLLLDDSSENLPGGLIAPEPKGWLEEQDRTNIFSIVDATHTGFEMRGLIGCPDDSSPVAATLDHNSDVHIACLDFSSQAHHVVFDVKRGTARVRGTYGVDYEEALVEYDEEPDARHFLAVPRRGPALLIYATYDEPELTQSLYRVHPLARGAKPFSLVPPQLTEVSEWTLYNHEGRVHALARAHKKGDEARALHKIAITAMGARMAGNLALSPRPNGDVFCHQLTTAARGNQLILRTPNEYGDGMLQTSLANSYAIPGPDSATADTDLCQDGSQVFLKVAGAEGRVLADSDVWNHRLACQGSKCILAYNSSEGTAIVPLTAPARRPRAR